MRLIIYCLITVFLFLLKEHPQASLSSCDSHYTPTFTFGEYDSTMQYIYLTFDDGPQAGTASCIALCKKLKVKATFFVISNQVKDSSTREIITKLKKGYPQFLIGNHSTNHAGNHYHYFYHHPEMAADDFFNAQHKLQIPFKIIRLPGNSAWVTADSIKASDLVKPICKILDSVGYNVIGWDVEWNFDHRTQFPVQTPNKLIAEVDSSLARQHLHTHNNVVILSHDRMFKRGNYLDSLEKFITLLKRNPKFVFETLDHYPNLKK